MKMEMKFSGCPFEDRETLMIYARAMDLYSALTDAQQNIRSRLKHHENVTDAEAEFLEQLRDVLYVDGLE